MWPKLYIAGEGGFPLNGVYLKPVSPEEADTMRQYFLQLRHETGWILLLLVRKIQSREIFQGRDYVRKCLRLLMGSQASGGLALPRKGLWKSP